MLKLAIFVLFFINVDAEPLIVVFGQGTNPAQPQQGNTNNPCAMQSTSPFTGKISAFCLLQNLFGGAVNNIGLTTTISPLLRRTACVPAATPTLPSSYMCNPAVPAIATCLGAYPALTGNPMLGVSLACPVSMMCTGFFPCVGPTIPPTCPPQVVGGICVPVI